MLSQSKFEIVSNINESLSREPAIIFHKKKSLMFERKLFYCKNRLNISPETAFKVRILKFKFNVLVIVWDVSCGFIWCRLASFHVFGQSWTGSSPTL